jgi:geranylgeranyl pyrophosphate synthase
MGMTEFEAELWQIRDNIRKRMVSTQTKNIFDIASGGKMLRGTLVINVFRNLCPEPEKTQEMMAYGLACCVEIIHGLTLAADDIIDQDEMRRGKPSLYTLKGFSMAFLEIISGLSVPYSIISPYGPEYVEAMAVTQRELCSGVKREILKDLPATTLYNIVISRKTGSLFALAAKFGAMAARAPEEKIEQMAAFGLSLGNTYQVQDDIEDLIAVVIGAKTKDEITGTEFILLKCVQMDDMAKQLVTDIQNGNIQKDKALSLLHSTGIVNALAKKREVEKAATIKLADGERLRQCVEYCIPEKFL